MSQFNIKIKIYIINKLQKETCSIIIKNVLEALKRRENEIESDKLGFNNLLSRLLILEKGFAVKISLVDIEGFSERICKARNLNQHCNTKFIQS
jgi:hypothetical protein